jgi:hypothetical protein
MKKTRRQTPYQASSWFLASMDGEVLFLDNAICMEPLVICNFMEAELDLAELRAENIPGPRE